MTTNSTNVASTGSTRGEASRRRARVEVTGAGGATGAVRVASGLMRRSPRRGRGPGGNPAAARGSSATAARSNSVRVIAAKSCRVSGGTSSCSSSTSPRPRSTTTTPRTCSTCCAACATEGITCVIISPQAERDHRDRRLDHDHPRRPHHRDARMAADEVTEDRIIAGMVGRDLEHRFPPHEPDDRRGGAAHRGLDGAHPTQPDRSRRRRGRPHAARAARSSGSPG